MAHLAYVSAPFILENMQRHLGPTEPRLLCRQEIRNFGIFACKGRTYVRTHVLFFISNFFKYSLDKNEKFQMNNLNGTPLSQYFCNLVIK
jgi:hypothetical protein